MATGTQHTILITGVSGQWGGRLARRLLAEPRVRLLGIDRRAPASALPGLDFIKADVRNPLLIDLLRAEQVQTVVHLAVSERQWHREAEFESNVLGSMQLIGACAEAGVPHVVLKSTMAVYGALPDSPMYVPEDWSLKARSTYAYVRDALEIEQFVQEFSAEYPDMRLAVLRFANIIGWDVDTALTRLLRQPALPSLLGFDPPLQVVDVDDVVEALATAALTGAHGPFNVAADGVLTLCQLAGMVGRPLLPILHWPLLWSWHVATGLPTGRRLLAWFPIEPDYLRFPCTGELTRMADVLGFRPQRTAEQAVEHYVQASRVARYQTPAEMRPFAAEELAEVLDERRRAAAADRPQTEAR